MINDLHITSAQKILDVGCGTGELTASIAKAVGPKGLVIGLDPDSERLALAKTQHTASNIQWIHTEVGNYQHEPQFFDACYSNYVLH